MSSIVSRRPETASDLGSAGSPMNHRKEAFWISIRLGTSSTFSSLEKVRRLLGAWVLAGKASPPEGLEGGFKRRGTGPTAQPRRVSARQVPRKRGRGRRLRQGILMGNSTCGGVPLAQLYRVPRSGQAEFVVIVTSRLSSRRGDDGRVGLGGHGRERAPDRGPEG